MCWLAVLNYDTMSSGRWLSTFYGNTLLQSLKLKLGVKIIYLLQHGVLRVPENLEKYVSN
jgi:hypothetical protein